MRNKDMSYRGPKMGTYLFRPQGESRKWSFHFQPATSDDSIGILAWDVKSTAQELSA